MGRALSEGKEPMTPALHWAITRSGFEMMNRGEPMTGIESWFAMEAGMAMEDPVQRNGELARRGRLIIPACDAAATSGSRRWSNETLTLRHANA